MKTTLFFRVISYQYHANEHTRDSIGVAWFPTAERLSCTSMVRKWSERSIFWRSEGQLSTRMGHARRRKSSSSSSGEEDGDAEWKAAIDSVASADPFHTKNFAGDTSKPSSRSNGELPGPVLEEDPDPKCRPQLPKHYQIKVCKFALRSPPSRVPLFRRSVLIVRDTWKRNSAVLLRFDDAAWVFFCGTMGRYQFLSDESWFFGGD